ncbi:unnamed protein product, partial [Prorocentrum cordatum]
MKAARVLLPVPGGPHTTYGCRAPGSSAAATTRCCPRSARRAAARRRRPGRARAGRPRPARSGRGPRACGTSRARCIATFWKRCGKNSTSNGPVADARLLVRREQHGAARATRLRGGAVGARRGAADLDAHAAQQLLWGRPELVVLRGVQPEEPVPRLRQGVDPEAPPAHSSVTPSSSTQRPSWSRADRRSQAVRSGAPAASL